MTSLISISLELDESFCKKIEYIQKKLHLNLNVKNYYLNHSKPHINLLSGKCSNPNFIMNSKLKRGIKKNKIKYLGLGIFPSKKNNVVYLRFENSNFINNLRSHLLKKFSKKFLLIDKTCLREYWIPKTTIASGDINSKKLTKVINYLNDYQFNKNTKPSKLCVLDYTIKEEKIFEIKI